MLLEHTLQHLTDLRLWGMKQTLQRQLEQPKTHDLSFEDRLGLLVEGEYAYRHAQRMDRLLKASKLRHTACLEDINYQHPRGIKREEISSLASGRWIKEAFNLLMTGPTGIGKSWIACALGHQACRLGFSVFYTRLPRLLEDLRLSRLDGSYTKALQKLARIDLLILDDWGLERFTAEQRRDLLEVVEDRHHLKSLLITSQLPPQAWYELIQEPTLADALLDRLLSRSIKMELTGDSLRKVKKMDA
jgi:DNA replication protein DnaC